MRLCVALSPLLLIGLVINAAIAAQESTSFSPLPPVAFSGPKNGSNLPFNGTIAISFGEPRFDKNVIPPGEMIPGLWQSIRMIATYPDMTEKLLYPTIGRDGGIFCGVGTSIRTTAFMETDQVGNYTVQWEITYGLSSKPTPIDPRLEACDMPPYTLETFTANRTYQVLDPEQTSTGKPVIATFTTIASGSVLTSLPAPIPVPTGPLPNSNGVVERVRGLAGLFCVWFFVTAALISI